MSRKPLFYIATLSGDKILVSVIDLEPGTTITIDVPNVWNGSLLAFFAAMLDRYDIGDFFEL